MAKILVLYYSSYGHIEAMAQAMAEGARSTGATVDIKRVPETAPLEVAQKAHFKLDQEAPVATVAELVDYDAIIIGTGTRFGRMSSQMAAFLDQAGGLWARGALNGKIGFQRFRIEIRPRRNGVCDLKTLNTVAQPRLRKSQSPRIRPEQNDGKPAARRLGAQWLGQIGSGRPADARTGKTSQQDYGKAVGGDEACAPVSGAELPVGTQFRAVIEIQCKCTKAARLARRGADCGDGMR